jgi:hypothetical protein
LALSLADYNGPDKLTAWATKVRENSGAYLEINRVKSDSSLKMRIEVYAKMDRASIEKKWKVVDREKDIVILENKQIQAALISLTNLTHRRSYGFFRIGHRVIRLIG